QKYTTDFFQWRSDMLSPTAQALEHTRARWLMAPLTEMRRLNGEVTLHLRIASSENIGLVSAMLVDYGDAKRLKQTPSATGEKIDRGVNFAPVPLMEFMRDNVSSHKMITIGHLNLQNRTAAWQNDDLLPNEWVEVSFGLQPTLYEVAAGHQLGLILYGTDFEMTIRGNQKIAYQIDLAQSSIELPWEE
uniref:CocE/NonD family hydrolase C-terminal non-catalytic domain-containing protein n=1 Tax=Weissella soli TaxID=155866 RepID=UPI00359F1D01